MNYVGVNMKTHIQTTEGRVFFFNQNLVDVIFYSEKILSLPKITKLSPQNLTPDLYCLYTLDLSHFSMYIKVECLITESCFICMQKGSVLAMN